MTNVIFHDMFDRSWYIVVVFEIGVWDSFFRTNPYKWKDVPPWYIFISITLLITFY